MSEIINDCVDVENLITDDVILNLKPLVFDTITSSDITEYIHLQCQKVLELAKEKNGSKEVARAINLNTFDILGTVMGDVRSVDIDFLVQQMQNTEYVFLVMHNHPSNMHFSIRDIRTFINADNMTILIVLGNSGAIYILEKCRQLSLNEILSARKTLIDWKNQIIDFKKVIDQMTKFGIVYKEL